MSADTAPEVRRLVNDAMLDTIVRLRTPYDDLPTGPDLSPIIRNANSRLENIGYRYRIPIPRNELEYRRYLGMADAVNNTSTPGLYRPGG